MTTGPYPWADGAIFTDELENGTEVALSFAKASNEDEAPKWRVVVSDSSGSPHMSAAHHGGTPDLDELCSWLETVVSAPIAEKLLRAVAGGFLRGGHPLG